MPIMLVNRMLFESRRSATIRTLCFCETLFLRRDSYMSVAAHFPAYAKKVRRRAIKVMWRNMLTSHTLKQALLNAATMREIELQKQKQEPTTVALAQSMQELMGSMTERLQMYEKKERIRSLSQDKIDELADDQILEDSGGSDSKLVENLQQENRRLRRRLTDEGLTIE